MGQILQAHAWLVPQVWRAPGSCPPLTPTHASLLPHLARVPNSAFRILLLLLHCKSFSQGTGVITHGQRRNFPNLPRDPAC